MAGNIRDTGRKNFPGLEEVTTLVNRKAREIYGDEFGDDYSPQAVYNWRERGISYRMRPVVCDLMQINPKQYAERVARLSPRRLLRGPPTPSRPTSRK